MAIRKVSFAPGEYYHLYNRGNSQQKIFHDKQDYSRFIDLLYACNSENNFRVSDLNRDQNFYDFERDKKLVSIGAYCLMPNHFHLLITEKEDGDISKFMQKVSTAYVMYYNKKYKRTGSLFEGKFKSTHTDTDRYLKYLFSYIHLNPVKLIDRDWKKGGIKNRKESLDYLRQYLYSSFFDYLGIQRIQNKVLDRKAFPGYFPNKKSFLKEILEWLSYTNN